MTALDSPAEPVPMPPSTPPTARLLRILLVAILLVLTAQGWTGDAVNIFLAPASGTAPPSQDLGGFVGAMQSLGPILIWHALDGLVIVVLAVAIAVLAFRWSKSRSVRMCAVLGLFFAIMGALGGYLFIMSGFASGAPSAQMGGSFIGTYAFYFMTLYFAK